MAKSKGEVPWMGYGRAGGVEEETDTKAAGALAAVAYYHECHLHNR